MGGTDKTCRFLISTLDLQNQSLRERIKNQAFKFIFIKQVSETVVMEVTDIDQVFILIHI